MSGEKLSEAIDKSYHDCFSDVDLSVVVRISPNDPSMPDEYVKRVDRLGICAENCLGITLEGNRLQRIVLKNGMRYDLGFEFQYDDNAQQINYGSEEEEADNPNWPGKNIDRFWFVQIQALGKLYRKDFLISSHLANMNLNETLVQQMVLRDIKYGTNHHRYGYEEELAYVKYENNCPIKIENDTFNMIADKLYCAARAYDELTKIFYPEYKERFSDFMRIWECYAMSEI